jgi:hypothetical protein
MSDITVTTTSIYLIPGMSAKLQATYDPAGGKFDFARMGPFRVNADKTVDLSETNGFYVEFPDVGDITAVKDEPAVIYKHKRPEPNSIWFIPHAGAGTRRGVINIVSVPIHDHSSIVQGGPAYGTYFSDDDVE